MNNKEWIFSGIGVFILTLIVTFFTTKKLKNDSVSKNFVTNKLKAKHIQVNQTIISDSKTGDVKIGDSTTIDRRFKISN